MCAYDDQSIKKYYLFYDKILSKLMCNYIQESNYI